MTWAHRSLDGAQLHDGLVEDCPDCLSHLSMHDPDSHHVYVDVSMAGIGAGGVCYCGDPEDSDIHEPPYCTQCRVPEPPEGSTRSGTRSGWRAVRDAVRRFVLGAERRIDWLGAQFSGSVGYTDEEIEQVVRRHPAGRKKGQEK